MKILLTSTSFQDTPGKHHDLLGELPIEVETLRGPLKESELMPIIADFDGLVCGDDELNRKVLSKGKEGRLKYISKYGVGLDKIDLDAAKEFGLVVNNCPGVNQVSVAEHVFALLLSFCRNVTDSVNATRAGEWKRMSGIEIEGKTLGVVGYGAIGKELVRKAIGFGLEVLVYDPYADIPEHINRAADLEELFSQAQIISLHVPLMDATSKMVNDDLLAKCNNTILVNTSRGGLVDQEAVLRALDSGALSGYLADVLENEPLDETDKLHQHPRVSITPHIGSRTRESVERQGSMAVRNLQEMIE